MNGKLPKSLYELKPLLYIASAALVLNTGEDYISAQAAFVALSAWALMILFMRRAFRLGLTDLNDDFDRRGPIPH